MYAYGRNRPYIAKTDLPEVEDPSFEEVLRDLSPSYDSDDELIERVVDAGRSDYSDAWWSYISNWD